MASWHRYDFRWSLTSSSGLVWDGCDVRLMWFCLLNVPLLEGKWQVTSQNFSCTPSWYEVLPVFARVLSLYRALSFTNFWWREVSAQTHLSLFFTFLLDVKDKWHSVFHLEQMVIKRRRSSCWVRSVIGAHTHTQWRWGVPFFLPPADLNRDKLLLAYGIKKRSISEWISRNNLVRKNELCCKQRA